MKYEVTFVGKKTYTVNSWQESLTKAKDDLKGIHPNMNMEIRELKLKDDN
tara:strand:+ start:2473 stop:2622 length:150 start_codon:yes stop_codon:yes gene_type:complete